MTGSQRRNVTWVGAAVVGALLLGVAVARSYTLAIGLASAIPLALACLKYPGRAASTLLAWGTVKYSVFRLVPSLGGALALVEMAVLVLVVLATAFQRRDAMVSGVKAYGLLVGFVVVALVSWLLNGGTVAQLLYGMRSLLTMPLLALVLVRTGTKGDWEWFWRLGVGATLLQIPVAYAQFAFGGLSTDVDLVNGTLGFGGANLLGVWMLAAAAGCMNLFIQTGRARALGLAVVFVSVIAMCGSRLSLLAIPVVVIGVGILAFGHERIAVSGARYTAAVVLISLVSALMVVGVYAGYERSGVGGGSAWSDLDPGTLIERQTRIGDYSVPRLAYLTYGWTYLQQNSAFVPIGTGPASAGSGAAVSASPDYESSAFATGLRIRGQGLATYADDARVVTQTSQAVSGIVEYGPLGFVLMLAFYTSVGVSAIRTLRSRPGGGVSPLVPAAFGVFFVFATLGSVYGVVWEGLNIIGLGFWWSTLHTGALGGLAHVDGGDGGRA